MKLKVDKKMSGLELSEAVMNIESVMFYKFQEMWRELNATLSRNGFNPLNDDAIITFGITWEGGQDNDRNRRSICLFKKTSS